MTIELELFQLKGLLQDATELGATKALTATGALKPYMSKSEAYKMYGRRQVDRWLREGLIKKIKDGTDTSNIRLDRVELETCAKTSNRASWFRNYK